MQREIEIDFIKDFGTVHAKRYHFTVQGITDCMNNNGDNFSCTVGEYFDRIIHGHYANIKTIRYTGLKDKNGKEIFEGDIVKNDDEIVKEVQWGYFSESVNAGECLNHCYGWHVGNGYEFEDYGEIHNAEKWEIIGSKFDNPELLTQ
jgi:uncharacterized phage protein (TIGR01671 family)